MFLSEILFNVCCDREWVFVLNVFFGTYMLMELVIKFVNSVIVFSISISLIMFLFRSVLSQMYFCILFHFAKSNLNFVLTAVSTEEFIVSSIGL